MANRRLLQYIILLLPALSIIYLIKFQIGQLPSNLYEILIYLVAISSFLYFPNWRSLSKKEKLGIGLIGLVSLIGLIISPDKTAGLGILKGWVIPAVLVYWMINRAAKSRKDWDLVLQGMVLQGLVVAVVAIGQHLPVINSWWGNHHFDAIQYLSTGRSTSIFNSPDSAAVIMVLSVLIACTLYKNYLDVFAILILLAGIISTKSRGAIVGIIISSIIYALWRKNQRKLGWLAFLVGLVAINPITLSLIANRNPDNMDVRVHIWRVVWQMLKAHPIFGYGLTNFQETFSSHTLHWINFDEFVTPYAVHPHNILLYTWFLLGFVGLLGLVLLVSWSIYHAVKIGRLYAILGASLLVSLVIHGMVDNTIWKNDLIIWFVVAVLLCSVGKISEGVKKS